MSKRFIVAIDSSTKAQDDQFLEALKEKKIAWWHWINNFWMLVDPTEKETASSILEEINKSYPDINVLVHEIRGGTQWAGYGPSGEKGDMFNWIKGTWSKSKKK